MLNNVDISSLLKYYFGISNFPILFPPLLTRCEKFEFKISAKISTVKLNYSLWGERRMGAPPLCLPLKTKTLFISNVVFVFVFLFVKYKYEYKYKHKHTWEHHPSACHWKPKLNSWFMIYNFLFIISDLSQSNIGAPPLCLPLKTLFVFSLWFNLKFTI